MKIGLVYRNIAVTRSGLGGGGDVFVIYLLRALKELGHEVVLATTKPTNWELIERSLGWVFRPDEERRLTIMPDVDGFRLYRNLLPAPLVEKLKKDCDVTFDAYGLNLLWNLDITYLHTPPTKDELDAKYSRGMHTKLYYKLYKYLTDKKLKKLKTKVLTNSEYSRRIIQETLGIDSQVVYPPVDTELYSKLAANKSRNNVVLTVGRYTWERKLDLIADLAFLVPEAEFYIVGNTIMKYACEVITFIKSKAERLGVSNRVHIHVDVLLKDKMDLMSKAKVYVNTLRDEHFGIAVAEAMSAGMVPIVPNSGGQCEIVPSKEFTYENIEEAADLIRKWLNDWNPSIAKRLSLAAEKFSYSRFKNEIGELLSTFEDPKL
ncbi:MAG: glycosyltransferase family 4 protein [Nitrososphaerota archaeon]